MTKYVNAGKMLEKYQHSIYDTTDLAEMLDYMPAADVVEVRHGKWEPVQYGCVCSVCGKRKEQFSDNFCANCGAKMEEEEE